MHLLCVSQTYIPPPESFFSVASKPALSRNITTPKLMSKASLECKVHTHVHLRAEYSCVCTLCAPGFIQEYFWGGLDIRCMACIQAGHCSGMNSGALRNILSTFKCSMLILSEKTKMITLARKQN